MRPAVERLVGKETPVAVFQYGIAVDDLAAIAAATPSTPEDADVRIVTARPLNRLYHTEDVVRAVALLGERGYRCVYDVAGDGEERVRLERLVEMIGVSDRVLFHGRLEEGDTVRLMAAADVYVSVAESDGVSIALLEALALGCLPVVSDIPANRCWVRDGENGVLVPIDPRGIAEGIERAVSLDRAAVRRTNLELVRADGDRSRNLARCEALLEQLVASAR
jgi:glycosyltransferase involved in cell wall biosynthesis